MPIKNRDGTPYKFSSPNPLMKNQTGWSRKGEFILYNCTWDADVYADPNMQVILKPKYEAPPIQKKALPTHPEEEVIVAEPPQELEDSDFAHLRDQAIQIHCLPARYREHKDALYGQRYKTIRYGNKFTFEGIIVAQEDLFMEFWTTVKEVTAGSVVFPMNRDKRWWRVDAITPKTGGLLIRGVLSDYQPDFS
jgi:hypothetical protein